MGLVKRNTNFLRILKSIFVKKIIFFFNLTEQEGKKFYSKKFLFKRWFPSEEIIK